MTTGKSRGKPFSAEQIALIDQRLREGRSAKQIYKEMGLPVRTFYTRLRASGKTISSPSERYLADL